MSIATQPVRPPRLAASGGRLKRRASALFEEKPNNFDVIRLVFALSVIYSHSYPVSGSSSGDLVERFVGGTDLGKVAVHGFFVISGYLILKSWIRNPSLPDYLQNRVLRIYPAYFVAFVVSILMGAIFGGVGPVQFYHAVHAVSIETWLLILQTIGKPPHLTGYVHDYANGDLNGAMWTLVYEFQCYLGVLALGVLRLAGKAWVSYVVFVGFYVAFISEHHNYFWSIQFFTYFAAGMCYYHLERHIPMSGYVCLALIGLIAALVLLDESVELALPFCLVYWVYYVALVARPMSWLRADLSYGTYLYGWPIEIAVFHFMPGVHPLLVTGISVLLALGAASLSWRFVELPALRRKRRPAPEHAYA